MVKRKTGKNKTKKKMAVEYIAQWYWQKDWKNEWQKSYYVGPRVEWMYILKDESGNTTKNTKINGTTDSVS